MWRDRGGGGKACGRGCGGGWGGIAGGVLKRSLLQEEKESGNMSLIKEGTLPRSPSGRAQKLSRTVPGPFEEMPAHEEDCPSLHCRGEKKGFYGPLPRTISLSYRDARGELGKEKSPRARLEQIKQGRNSFALWAATK